MEYRKIMRKLRETAGMTQKEVATYLGTSQTMYARYERGANEMPIRHLVKICELFDVTSDHVLGLDTLPKPPARRKTRREAK